jgi:hypothetical protein
MRRFRFFMYGCLLLLYRKNFLFEQLSANYTFPFMDVGGGGGGSDQHCIATERHFKRRLHGK